MSNAVAFMSENTKVGTVAPWFGFEPLPLVPEGPIDNDEDAAISITQSFVKNGYLIETDNDVDAE